MLNWTWLTSPTVLEPPFCIRLQLAEDAPSSATVSMTLVSAEFVLVSKHTTVSVQGKRVAADG